MSMVSDFNNLDKVLGSHLGSWGFSKGDNCSLMIGEGYNQQLPNVPTENTKCQVT